jgi:2,5-dioxopentanoate dehydrogenase
LPQSDLAAPSIVGIDPRTGARLEPGFPAASAEDVARLCEAAGGAFDPYRQASLEQRASLLEGIAEEILAVGDSLVGIAVTETGLPAARIQGERGRTVGQLRLFAEVVREGDWLGARIDTGLPDRTPAPRPDLRLRHIPVGPFAVFGASNFPLAFSVAGGDTASALAAGCPVVVKAHPSHPGTSELVAGAIARAVQASGLPGGTFGMLHSADNAISGLVVADPRIKAVGFTGSRSAGQALMAIAAAREEPIPVYAEMSSINPVIVLPAALALRGDRIASGYAASLTLGVGQFCTNPGLMIILRAPHTRSFLAAVTQKVEAIPAATMLSPTIHSAHSRRLSQLEHAQGVDLIARGQAPSGPFDASASVFVTSGARFRADAQLAEEVFGPTGLVVACETIEEMQDIVAGLEGQLTISLHLEPDDYPVAAELLPLLERKAGRIVANGFPTGVEVSRAMVHGGPYPATSDGRSTSVGTLAINRFLRPVCYQDMPQELLPEVLRDDNPAHVARLVDGSWQRG